MGAGSTLEIDFFHPFPILYTSQKHFHGLNFAEKSCHRQLKCFARRVLLKTLIKLQEMVGADQEMVHKDYKAPRGSRHHAIYC